ncbi:MAG: hypothetical protein M3070_07630 [Actinomycetota bacterium]|nr:hypothetical protein [Actinomycetota bacterium]
MRRVWWPVSLLPAATLLGVGASMFWPYSITTHLGWLAAAVALTSAVFASLIAGLETQRRSPA